MRKSIVAVAGLALLLAALPACGQSVARYNLFGGAILGSPSGFLGGGQLIVPFNRHISFVPGIAVGRSGHTGLFTASGTFRYEFHPDDEAFIPYLLGGVGLTQWGSATHGSPIGGLGARIPVGHGTWIVPEVRAGTHGLSRFTIGISKSF